MAEMTGLTVIGLGFLLGLKHATDADHVVAITTMLSEERRFWRSCWIGVFWGIGHTISLVIAGLTVVLLKTPISPSTASSLEFLVAVMLVFLGARILVEYARREFGLHKHPHVHPGKPRPTAHTHWHLHSRSLVDSHVGWTHIGLRPLMVGLVHGAAGSAALTVLVLSTIDSAFSALFYILIFGTGSILGMLSISILLTVPFSWAGKRADSAAARIQALAGLFSCIFGVYYGLHSLLG